MKKDLIRLEG